MAANDWLAQDLADMLDLEVERPAFVETTALGAAMLAGVGAGLFGSLEEAAAMRGAVRAVRAGDGGGDARGAAGGLEQAVARCWPDRHPELDSGSGAQRPARACSSRAHRVLTSGPDDVASSRCAGACQLSSIILMIAEKSLPPPPSASAKRA